MLLLHQVLDQHELLECQPRGKPRRWAIVRARSAGRSRDPALEYVVASCSDAEQGVDVTIKLTACADRGGGGRAKEPPLSPPASASAADELPRMTQVRMRHRA